MRIRLVGVALAVLGIGLGLGIRAAELEREFVQPPASARPHTWWHWMNGNVTREGITADLEAMARAGVGGAQIFNAHCGIPEGPVVFNSPEWLALVKHAAGEARRLGLELCIHNCAGWSSSGGPWNTPENGMKIVVTREIRTQGPARFEGALPQPRVNLDFYRDIAVLAFPTPVGELSTMREAAPQVTTSRGTGDPQSVADGNPGTAVQLVSPRQGAPAFIQLAFAEPYAARTLVLTPGGDLRGCRGRIEVSDDGETFRSLQDFTLGRGGEVRTFSFAPATARFYRLVFVSVDSKVKRLRIGEVDFSRKIGISSLAGKIFLAREGFRRDEPVGELDPAAVVPRGRIVDLTSRMGADGQLAWDVPAGDWTILRLGYTPNGRRNHPAPAAGTGLECDKLSKAAAQAHWDGMMGPVLAELGPLAGNVESGLNNVLIDSYEVGCQNWTQGFAEEFRQRRGYDITPFLPAFTGRVVDSQEVTERFLWDLRRTIADLFAENYSGQFAEMARRAGLQYSLEPYGDGPFDDLQFGSFCDIPMSEFWVGSGTNPGNAKLAASVAHVYGRKFVGAEAFTASPEAGRWQQHPYSLKAQGDAAYCAGVNRIIYHRYAHQPWLDRLPGMTMGQWGTHFDRTNTWWEQGKNWLAYQARCQYLLQQGLFVADVCFYSGEDAPNSLRGGGLPKGYDYDGCDTGAVMQMTVRDGRIVLPSGMSYRILALPNAKTMTPAVLRKIGELARAGATIVGPKPEQSPSLAGYPECDHEVKMLADQIWAEGVRDQSPTEALAALGVKPDFLCLTEGARVTYIHRQVDGADLYFVASQKTVADEVECVFRVAGKVPELWHPDTGATERAPVYSERDGLTILPLRFDPAGSVFVVFRQPAAGDHAVALRSTVADAAPKIVYELKILKATYGVFGEEAAVDWVDVTAVVKNAVKGGNRRIAASNSLAGDPAPNVVKELKIDFLLNGEKGSVRVGENQTAEVPAGAEVVKAVYGLVDEVPAAPPEQVVDLTAKLGGLVKDGALAVRADNALAGKDPAHLVFKELRVEYEYRGQVKQVRVRENAMLILPEETQQLVPVPACELVAGTDGSLDLLVWKNGTFEVDMASGQTRRAEVADLPPAVGIEGVWQLAFPPGWGAPASVALDKLISWTEHADEGVKYFSGTATYTKTFAWPAGKPAYERYVLDLGDLRNLAEIELNGQNLGVLWKPPFRVDVTDALRAGDNTLTVKVTNLWVNRLIGDEQLPEDREWKGKELVGWPEWLLEGKPSPTGRRTFTTWHHWTRDDQPLLSGLFGPVQVRTVRQASLH